MRSLLRSLLRFGYAEFEDRQSLVNALSLDNEVSKKFAKLKLNTDGQSITKTLFVLCDHLVRVVFRKIIVGD